jgi:hypothetical protein
MIKVPPSTFSRLLPNVKLLLEIDSISMLLRIRLFVKRIQILPFILIADPGPILKGLSHQFDFGLSTWVVWLERAKTEEPCGG